MRHRHSNWLVPLLYVFVLALTAMSYAVAYLTLGDRAIVHSNGTSARIYPSKWLSTLFMPAGRIESIVSGEEISVGWRGWD
jgi:hypothetical protein